MLRTLFSAKAPQDATPAPAAVAGPQAIDPADFKFIGGGAPRGGWPDTESVVVSTDTADTTAVAAPRGGW